VSELKEMSILVRRHQRDPGRKLWRTAAGQLTGPMKRQYWGKEGGQWKILFEGVIG
jgi:uncharacterized glyoxalase superfamily protein PhnB